MTQQILKPVYYDPDHGEFFYQLEEDTPLMGPFRTRAEAIADAAFSLHPFRYRDRERDDT